MTKQCTHLDQIRNVTPSARGCEDCLKIGDTWVELRLCLSRGHVGCCDSSNNKHATKHFRATQHPTNPEELLGAAHAGCFSMALAAQLTAAGYDPQRLLLAPACISKDRASVTQSPGSSWSSKPPSRGWTRAPFRSTRKSIKWSGTIGIMAVTPDAVEFRTSGGFK